MKSQSLRFTLVAIVTVAIGALCVWLYAAIEGDSIGLVLIGCLRGLAVAGVVVSATVAMLYAVCICVKIVDWVRGKHEE